MSRIQCVSDGVHGLNYQFNIDCLMANSLIIPIVSNKSNVSDCFHHISLTMFLLMDDDYIKFLGLIARECLFS